MKEEEVVVIDITDIFKILRKRIVLILGFTFISTVLTGIISYCFITPQYASNTKLIIGKETVRYGDYNTNDIILYQKLLNTYTELIKTSDLIESALKDNNIDISPEQVLSGLSVTSKVNTQFLTVTYKSSDPNMCKEVLDLVIEEFIKESKKMIPNVNIQVIEKSKLPKSPISPNKRSNIKIGFLVGLMFGISVAFCLEYKDNTVLSAEKIEEVLDVPVVGRIPVEI